VSYLDETTPISGELAEQCLTAVRQQFAAYLDGDQQAADAPRLIERWDSRPHWAIVWESGPDHWAERAFVGGHDEELYELARDAFAENHIQDPEASDRARQIARTPPVGCPDGVFAEPFYSYLLVLHPAGDTTDDPDEPDDEPVVDDDVAEWPVEGLAFYTIGPDKPPA
jgi:hypothetical protein